MKSKYLLFSFITFSILISCGPKQDISERQILISQTSPPQTVNHTDSLRSIDLNYNIAILSEDDYGYIAYRIISEFRPSALLKKKQVDLKHIQIIQKGLVQQLKKSKSDRRYRELDFNFTYKVNEFGLNRHPSHSKYSYEQKAIDNRRSLNTIDLLCNNQTNGIQLCQDIGIIVYKIPFPKAMNSETDFPKEYQKLIETHQFNLDSLSLSREYYDHLEKITMLGKKGGVKIDYGEYLNY